MTDMIERAARALAGVPMRDWQEPGGELDRLRLREAVRAVLRSIREPSEAMIEAGERVGFGNRPADYFTAMIDAIIKDAGQ